MKMSVVQDDYLKSLKEDLEAASREITVLWRMVQKKDNRIKALEEEAAVVLEVENLYINLNNSTGDIVNGDQS
jgi:predicted secreted acid phosphatase